MKKTISILFVFIGFFALGQQDITIYGSNARTAISGGSGISYDPMQGIITVDTTVTVSAFISQIRGFGSLTPATKIFNTKNVGQQGLWYCDLADVTTADNTGTVLVDAIGRRWKRIITDGRIRASWYNWPGTANPTASDSFKLKAMTDDCQRLGVRRCYFTAGSYGWYNTVTLANNYCAGLVIEGDQNPSLNIGVGGTYIKYMGTGIMIQTAADDGLPEDTQLFNGTEQLTFRNVTIAALNANQVPIPGLKPYGLPNSTYVPGSQCIVDRRGGGLTLDHVNIVKFERSIWAYNSDFDRMNDVYINSCLIGLHLRAHSDQGGFSNMRFFACQRAIEIYSTNNAAFWNTQLITVGTPSVNPVGIFTDSTGWTNTGVISFDNLWVEQNGKDSVGIQPDTIRSIFELNQTSNVAGNILSLAINHVVGILPTGTVNGSINDRRVQHFIQVNNNIKGIKLYDVNGITAALIDSAIQINGSYSPVIDINGGTDANELRMSINQTGTPADPKITHSGPIFGSSVVPNIVYQSGYNGRWTSFYKNDDNAFRRLATISVYNQGTFSGAILKVTILDANGQYVISNGGATPNISPEQRFYISLYRADGVNPDDQNIAIVSGTSTSYLKVIKLQNGSGTSAAIFEIDVQGSAAFKSYKVDLEDATGPANAHVDFDQNGSAATTSGVLATYLPSRTPDVIANQVRGEDIDSNYAALQRNRTDPNNYGYWQRIISASGATVSESVGAVGTGPAPTFWQRIINSYVQQISSLPPYSNEDRTSSSTGAFFSHRGISTASSGIAIMNYFNPYIAQSASGGFTAMQISIKDSLEGSGPKLAILVNKYATDTGTTVPLWSMTNTGIQKTYGWQNTVNNPFVVVGKSTLDSSLVEVTTSQLAALVSLTYKHTIFTPTTGGTVNLSNNQYNIINPAGALVSVTLNLPSSPANNDVVYIKFTQTISTVTYSNGTVVDGITAPTAGGLVVLTYDSVTTSWY